MKQYGNQKVFIGEVIKRRVDELGMSHSEFARRINCSRTSLYNLFAKKSIDVDLLLLISEVLDYDFLAKVYHHGQQNIAHPSLSCLDKEEIESLTEEISLLLRKRLGGGVIPIHLPINQVASHGPRSMRGYSIKPKSAIRLLCANKLWISSFVFSPWQ